MSNVTFGCNALNAEVNPAVSNAVVWVLSTSSFSVTFSPSFSSATVPPLLVDAVVSVGSVASVVAPAGDTTASDATSANPLTAANVLSPVLMTRSPFNPDHTKNDVRRFNFSPYCCASSVSMGECDDMRRRTVRAATSSHRLSENG